MEAELGLCLFERLGRSVYPTVAGQLLVAEAESLLGRFDRVVERLHHEEGAGASVVRIGASTTPGLYVLPSLLRRLLIEIPQLQWDCTIGDTDTIAASLLANTIDVALVGGRIEHAHLHVRAIAGDRIVCFSGKDHALAQRPELSASELTGQTWILGRQGSATRKLGDAALVAMGVSMAHVVEVPGPEAAKVIVAAGVGLSFGSQRGLSNLGGSPSLVALPVADFDVTRTLSLVHHVDKHMTPALQAFIRLASEETAVDGAEKPDC